VDVKYAQPADARGVGDWAVLRKCKNGLSDSLNGNNNSKEESNQKLVKWLK